MSAIFPPEIIREFLRRRRATLAMRCTCREFMRITSRHLRDVASWQARFDGEGYALGYKFSYDDGGDALTIHDYGASEAESYLLWKSARECTLRDGNTLIPFLQVYYHRRIGMIPLSSQGMHVDVNADGGVSVAIVASPFDVDFEIIRDLMYDRFLVGAGAGPRMHIHVSLNCSADVAMEYFELILEHEWGEL